MNTIAVTGRLASDPELSSLRSSGPHGRQTLLVCLTGRIEL
jgi:single-stranded DNA-binding protein